MIASLKHLIPPGIRDLLRRPGRLLALPAVKRLRYFGWRRHCPVCGAHLRRFLPFGVAPRPVRAEALCPVCRALERQRLKWLYLRQSDLFDKRIKHVLYVAPRPGLAGALARDPNIRLVTGDLLDTNALLPLDLTRLYFPDGLFDLVICSNVLEHIPDDTAAIREIHRVLKPGGWAMILVPIWGTRGVEDPTLTSAEARARAFGQHDHVRLCGPDYYDRLRATGFGVTIVRPADLATPGQIVRYGLGDADELAICRKADA